jgi:hypothetical protein
VESGVRRGSGEFMHDAEIFLAGSRRFARSRPFASYSGAVRAAVVSIITLLVSSALADDVPYKGGPVPPNMHVERRRDQAVLEAGGGTFVGLYVLSMWSAGIAQLVCNGSCTDRSYALLLVPIAGPAIAAAMPGVQRLSPAWSVILVADSIGQFAGAAVALVAYLLPTKRVVVKNAWQVMPTFGGVAISATF